MGKVADLFDIGRWGIIYFLVGIFVLLNPPEYLYELAWPGHIAHHFFHANVFHLAVNCLAVWSVFSPQAKLAKWVLPVAFVIGSFSYCFAAKPTIGFSNILFAIAGIRTPSFHSPWWRTVNCWVFIGTMVLMFFLPMFSATTHLVSFAIGVAVSACVRFKRKLDYDTRRAKGGR